MKIQIIIINFYFFKFIPLNIVGHIKALKKNRTKIY